ncbi:unnamed protein product [Paramecium octaurelia]|uniref:Uncharacterized protein n=1 Tax=Paramecium octaurelia TaxID=43137 RepID=A0A8S1XA27_PAROT|nr:unnamed protein product [Paramecium octaurelia]
MTEEAKNSESQNDANKLKVNTSLLFKFNYDIFYKEFLSPSRCIPYSKQYSSQRLHQIKDISVKLDALQNLESPQFFALEVTQIKYLLIIDDILISEKHIKSNSLRAKLMNGVNKEIKEENGKLFVIYMGDIREKTEN